MAEAKPAIERTLKFEDSTLSGKVTHDAGGRTRFGIAQKFHPDLPDEFFTGPAEDALDEAEQIMETDYWDPLRLAEVEDQGVASKLFDMAVNMGTHQAGIYAQRAVNFQFQQTGQVLLNPPATADDLRHPSQVVFPLQEDGRIGPKTIAAINAVDPEAYYDLLKQFSAAHYNHIATNNPAQAVNLAGWLKRAEA